MRPASSHVVVTLALCLVGALFVLLTAPPRAQAATPTVSISTLQSEVYEGGLVVFTVRRQGSTTGSLTVQVRTWEPDFDDPPPNNTERIHNVTIPSESRTATLRTAARRDLRIDPANTTLNAEVLAPSDGSYIVSNVNQATVEIIDWGSDPPLPVISIDRHNPTIVEGAMAEYRFNRGGDTTHPVTLDIRVDDPGNVLRGNSWDPPPEIPTQVVIPAGTVLHIVPIPVPDDQRDIPRADLTVVVLPSFDYLVGSGVQVSDSVRVSDNDTAQELELNFGKEGVNDADVAEGDRLAFVVKRRQQDINQTATFTVRLETDRSGDDNLVDGWTEDTTTGRFFKDYPLELTGSDLEVKEQFYVPVNGESETNWRYWASIRPLEDHGGNALSSTEEAEYWTVKSGFRETEIDATDSGASNGIVTLDVDTATVTEGGQVVFSVHRVEGPFSKPVTVQVLTAEVNRQGNLDTNPSAQYHNVTIQPWDGKAEFIVYPFVDGETETTDNLRAILQTISDSRYEKGIPSVITVQINDPPSGSALVAISADKTSMNEGESAVFTVTRTGGDTAQPLTVDIRVDDPNDLLRGNHWDAPPDIPTQVVIAAGSTTSTVTLTAPDDQRDLDDGDVTVSILTSPDYLVDYHQLSASTTASVSVTDNDTAQELSLKWGWVDFGDSSWEPGEAYLTCAGGTCTSGPAEGLFYYEDGRTFSFANDIEEYWPAHFEVRRRNQDKGKTVSFVVRVEHNRGWESPRHADWPINPLTGKHYKEFPLTLAGDQTTVIGRIENLDNGLVDTRRWKYSAEIKQVEDSGGTALAAAEEAQYWSVNGSRKKTIEAAERNEVQVDIIDVDPSPVPEGQAVTFTLKRLRGNPLEPLTVQLRTWEPNQQQPDGTNPTNQIHDIVFPAIPMTDRWVDYVTQTQTLTVFTEDDAVYETQGRMEARLYRIDGGLYRSYNSQRTEAVHEREIAIEDDDFPDISLLADTTSITEGETVTFTLTRSAGTGAELIVGVSVLDPGGFLEGNSFPEAVSVPSSVIFAPGEDTKTVVLTPPDDWRDIPDSSLTFTVEASPDYAIPGSSSLTVQVADNDVAPQVSIRFADAEVEEGTDLVLVIERIGEDKNPLDITLTTGPMDDQEYMVAGMDAGMSTLHVPFSKPDDSFRGPDHHYEATLHEDDPEFWTAASTATITGSILDNDPYVVSLITFRDSVDEGTNILYRLTHNGHTGDPLQVQVNHAETGNAIYDGNLGDQTHTIPAGSSGVTRGVLTHRNDGSDGDAEFIVTLLPDDAYEIDAASDQATVIVRDTDPIPILGFRDTGTLVTEAAGTLEIWVDMIPQVAALRPITVDYSVTDAVPENGINIVESAGTLTFAPGDTSAAIEVEVLQNSIAGNNDEFTVTLTNPVNATLLDGATSLTHQGVIEDDEPRVTLEARTEEVNEGNDAVFDLTRTGDTTNELTVWVHVVKTAPQALNRRDAVVFPAGSDKVEHRVATVNDHVRDGDHTATATLLDPLTVGEPRTYLAVSPTSGTVTVKDSSVTPVDLYTATSLRITEGDTIRLELFRNLSTAPITVALQITTTGQFTTGALPTTVDIGQSVDLVTVEIRTEDDSVVEDTGQVTVTLLDGTAYRAGWPNSHTFTIYDNDAPSPYVSVSRDQAWVDEGQPVSFTVTRGPTATGSLQARLKLHRVRYRVTPEDLTDPTRGISTPPDHIYFDAEEITVDFPDGTRTVTVSRSTTDDSLPYGNSSYHATVLTDASDDYVALSNSSAKIWVRDNDIPTVTGSADVSEFYDSLDSQVVLPFSRTGDVSGLLKITASQTQTSLHPVPAQILVQVLTANTENDERRRFEPGEAANVEFQGIQLWQALGASVTAELSPHYCPNDPGACGYRPQYQVGTPGDITYRIYSNIMGVRIEADQASVGEGDSATFTLHRHGGKPDSITRPLTVKLEVTQEGDYISGAAPQTVTFAANEATATLSVPTSDDAVDESDGSITVALQHAGGRDGIRDCTDDQSCYRLKDYPGTPWYVRTVTTTVTDDDYVPPTVSVADASARENDGTMEFTVSLDRANTEEASSVDWTTSEDGTTNAATSGTDFTADSGTLNFAIGETTKTVSVTLLDDDLDESHETFNIVLSGHLGLTLGDGTATGTILDDELAYGVQFRALNRDYVEEGEDLVIRIQRLPPRTAGEVLNTDDPCFDQGLTGCFDTSPDADPGGVPLTVNVRVTQEGNVIAGTFPTTATFAPDSLHATLTIPTDDDASVEPDGKIKVEILNGSGYSPLSLGNAQSTDDQLPTKTLTVYDNDLSFSVDDVAAREDAGVLDFTISLNAAAPKDVSVDVATADGEATSHGNVTATSLGQDFTARAETLTFLAGEQTKTFSVPVLDDSFQEKLETFSVVLSNNPRHTTLADDTGEGAIRDDEQPMVASVTRTYNIVDEQQSGPVRFMVQLTHPDTTNHERNPSVGWQTAAGTATEGMDYQGADGKVTFLPGETTRFIDIQLLDDDLFEAALETFRVELDDQDIRLLTLSPNGASFEASIRDNETLTAHVEADAETVAEGNYTTFTVTLTGSVGAEAVNVAFETAGSATPVDDFGTPIGAISFPPGNTSGSAGTLEIPAGQASGTITYPVLADSDDDEGNETLKVVLFRVSSGSRTASLSSDRFQASTTILDQDSLTVSLQAAPSVVEGSPATFTVTLSTASGVDVSVDWATAQAQKVPGGGDVAEEDSDYPAATGTVSIPAGDTSATFTVATTDDTLVEDDETFLVVLEEARKTNANPAEMVPLGVTEAVGTITDNDTAPDGLTFTVTPNKVAEDAGPTDLTVTVTLDGTTQFTEDTPVTVEMINRPNVDRNAILDTDYTATTANVTIPPGQTSVTATITLTPVDDSISEGDEVARLSVKSSAPFGPDGQGVNIGKAVTIEDNDTEPGEIELEVTPDNVNELASEVQLRVKASLVGQSSRPIDTIVTLELADDTAIAGEDFTYATSQLTIPAGQMTAIITLGLTVLDDDIAEGDETLNVTGSTAGTIQVLPAKVVIEDNDLEPTSISLLATVTQLDEGSGEKTVPVRATLIGGGTRSADTVVVLSVADLTATSVDDYSAAWDTQTITIPEGEFSATANLSLSPIEDNTYEGTEFIAVRGTNSDPGLPVNGVRLAILDNDPKPTTITISLDDDTVSEGEVFSFLQVTVTLEGDSTLASEVDININLANTTRQSRQYSGTFYSPLMILPGQSSGSALMRITGLDDDVEDSDEVVEFRGTADLPGLAVVPAKLTITNDDSSGVRVSPTSLNLQEGTQRHYAVSLRSEPTSDVIVTVDVPANAGFTVTPESLTFTPNSWGSKRITVTATQDDDGDDEAAAVITHTITTDDNSYRSIVPENVTIAIRDDDDPLVVASFSADTYTALEGGTVEVTVNLNVDPERPVTIPLTVAGQDGATSADYSGVPANITFASAENTKTFTFTATQDTEVDNGESVKLGFGTMPDRVSAGTPAETTVTITDDDLVPVQVSFEQGTYTVAEGSSVAVKVKLDADPDRTVIVPLTHVGQSDTSSDDYSGVPATVTFNDGDTEKEITFSATADDIDDDGDSVKLGFGTPLPEGVSAGDTDEAEVSITDDDSVGVTISKTFLDITEGDTGTYTVVLDSQPAGHVTVTIGGITDTDLSLDETVLTFTADNWDSAQQVTVTAKQDDDAIDEPAVTITHTVSSTVDTDYDGLAAAGVAVTVADDETPSAELTLTMPIPTHGDTDNDGKVNLGDTLAYAATATNSGNIALANVNVKDALVDTSGTDCATLAIGDACNLTVTYTIVQADVDAGSVTNTATASATGADAKTVTRETLVDQIESLTLEKTTTASGFDGTGESISYSYKVTNTGTVTLSGTLEVDDDKIESEDITCPVVPAGGLAPGSNLTCTGSYTTVQADVDAGRVTNRATASLDGVISGEDGVTVNWRAPQGNQPQLTVSSGEDDEDAGSFTFIVTLNPSSAQTVTVDYATSDGTATSGSDYTSDSGTLSFSPGSTSKNVSVTIADDDLDEADETFSLMLSNAVNADIQIASGSATIRDDDTAGVTVSTTGLEIDEGDEESYTVVLDSQPTHSVTVTVNDPANTDVTADPASLTFTTANWAATQTVRVTVGEDDDALDETATITHTAASTDAKYAGISVGTVLVSVTDQDEVPVAVSFEQASYTVDEGSSVTVKVKLDADPERTVTIPVTTANQGGASNSDYSGVPNSVTFNSGDREKTFSFTAASDNDNDDDESVKLGFGTLPAGVTAGTTNESTVSITDNDVPSVEVSYEQSTYTVAEGSTVNITVTLSADPERTIRIPLTVTNLGGASNDDHSLVPEAVTFNSGQESRVFTFRADQDTHDDDEESVKLGFGTLPAGVTTGTTNEATVSITDDDLPSVEVSFEQSNYTVAEGSSVSVKVKLSADPEGTVDVPITVTEMDGASSDDFSGIPDKVTFNSTETEKAFDIAATQDTVDDDGERLRLTFGTLPARVTSAAPSQTVVSFSDDDVPSVTVSYEQSAYTVDEGSSVTVKVQLDADPERTVTIPVTTANQGGASNSDYSGVPNSVTFNSGDREKTFSFSAASDNDNDDDESVKLGFGTLPAGVTAGTTNESTVSITDNDVPSVEVSYEQSTYTVAEGSTVNITVTLSADPERTIRIPLTVTNQGGASDDDHSLVPDAVTFNSGQESRVFTFRADQDTHDDDEESVKLGFGTLPDQVSEGTNSVTTVSITDDDVPSVTVSYEQSSYTVAEGSSVTVKVKLDVDPERTVTIPVTTINQGGASNSDYSGVPNSVTFNSAEREKTFSFTAASDNDNDDGESVKLTFGTLPTGVSEGTTNESTVSITDDDVPSVVVSFEQGTYTVDEGGSVTVKVKLDVDPERTVTIPLTTTNQGGASNSDYSGVPNSVTFNSAEREETFSFTAASDNDNDDGESVKLTFGTLPTGVSAGPTNEATVSITDDDVPSVVVSFEQGDYTVAEGGSVTVKVKLDADPERTVTIPVTTINQGGATSADYYGVPNSVTFNSADREKTFSFNAASDSVNDDGESVKIGFGTLPVGVTAGTSNEATVSITDDDVPSVVVSFEQGTYTVDEGGSVTVKVKLDVDPERTVTIPLTTTNQGGASNSDYSGVPTSVTFNSAEREETFSFTATSDNDNDDGESVKLTFGTLPTGVSAGPTNEATVSITDDDVPSVVVSFEQGTYTVAEGGSVTVKVKLDADPERTVTIALTTTNQGGASNSDYSGVPNSVTFNSADREETFSFAAASDSDNDDGESVKIGFGTLPVGVTAGTTNEATVSITDDDVPSVTVSFEQGTYTVAEGGSVTVKVKLDADPERTVTIPLTTTNQGGASNSDYSGVPTSVTFNSAEREKTFSFTAASDNDNDDGESVKLTFGTLPTGVSAGTTNDATVSITDDDVPSVTVNYEQSSYTDDEGSSVTVKVKLDADPERTVTIPVTTANQGGASNSDYSGVPNSVTFNSGDREKTFSFSAASDNDNDDDESVKLGFGTLPAGVTAGTTNESTVSITDNDVPSVEVSYEQSTYTVAEGSTVNITVTLSADPERTIRIPLTVTNQGGASDDDHSLVPDAVTFNSGQESRVFTFRADQDTHDDDEESVKLGFGTLPDQVSEGTNSVTTVSITDDDVPSVTVSFEQGSYTVAEGSSVTVKVKLDVDPRANGDDTRDDDQPGRGFQLRLLRCSEQRHVQ